MSYEVNHRTSPSLGSIMLLILTIIVATAALLVAYGWWKQRAPAAEPGVSHEQTLPAPTVAAAALPDLTAMDKPPANPTPAPAANPPAAPPPAAKPAAQPAPVESDDEAMARSIIQSEKARKALDKRMQEVNK
jgi:hypothetical protein